MEIVPPGRHPVPRTVIVAPFLPDAGVIPRVGSPGLPSVVTPTASVAVSVTLSAHATHGCGRETVTVPESPPAASVAIESTVTRSVLHCSA